MKNLLIQTAAACSFVVLALNSYAAQGNSDMKMESMEMGSSKAMTMNEGKVISVDKAAKNVTIKHGPVKSKTVVMGPMTMTFLVEKASLLSKVRAGDRVKFTVENVNDHATVTALQVQK